MAIITMWRQGNRACVLVVGEARSRYTLRVIDAAAVVRSEVMQSADHAVLVSEIWREEEQGSLYGAAPPM